MSRKLDNEFSPFDDVWADVDMQKEDILEQNGKKTVLTLKQDTIDFKKIILKPKDDTKKN